MNLFAESLLVQLGKGKNTECYGHSKDADTEADEKRNRENHKFQRRGSASQVQDTLWRCITSPRLGALGRVLTCTTDNRGRCRSIQPDDYAKVPGG